MLPANLESELLRPGEVTLLAGPPGQGKTSLALQLAVLAADRKDPAIVFSLKTASWRLTRRLLCLEARLPLTAAMSDQLGKAEQKKAAAVMKRLAKLPLHIEDSAASIEQIVKLSRRLAEKARAKGRRTGLLVIDYLERLSEMVDDGAKKNAAGVSRTLQALALELDAPVLVMSLGKRPADTQAAMERDISKVLLTVKRRAGGNKRFRLKFDRTTGLLSKS